MRRLLLLFGAVLSLLYLTHCSQATIPPAKATVDPNTTDPKIRLLQGLSGTPPCWEGICPGTTAEDDVIDLLKANPIIDPDSVHEEKFDVSRYVTWTFVDPQSDWEGRIIYSSSDDFVSHISFTTPDLCLGEIVDTYKAPDYLSRIPYEVTGWLDLLWMDEGILYENQLTGTKPQITSKTCGGGLVLFQSNIPFDQIPGVFFLDIQPKDMAPWTGYGNDY